MGNQESVPANPGLIKKKKVKQKQKPVTRKTTNTISKNSARQQINYNDQNQCNGISL